MSVVSMIGSVDGTQIIFAKDSSGSWTTTIPKGLDGEYIVNIKAYDEAGNVSETSTMLFSVNIKDLKISLVPLTYSYSLGESETDNEIIISEFAYYVVNRGFNTEVITSDYAYFVKYSTFVHSEIPSKFNYEVVS